MILSIIILLLSIMALVSGYHRGFVNEFLKLIGLIIALMLASNFADVIATWLRTFFNLFVVNKVYSNHGLWHGVGFVIVFVITLMLVRVVTRFFDRIASLPILRQLNAILGAGASLIIWLLLMALIIDVVLLFKVDWMTVAYQNSTLAQLLVNTLGQIFTF